MKAKKIPAAVFIKDMKAANATFSQVEGYTVFYLGGIKHDINAFNRHTDIEGNTVLTNRFDSAFIIQLYDVTPARV